MKKKIKTTNKSMKYSLTKRDILKIILGLAVGLLFFTACKVGLGETVDVLPPEVTISYPSPLEKVIIRDEFIMTGTVKDDVAVTAVHISFAGKENAIQYKYGPYITTLNAKNNTWSFTLNIPDTTSGELIYPIKDAVYTVTVTAYDNSGRTTSVTADYEIDNTAPVVVMQQPGEAEVLDEYGQPTIIPEAYGTLLKIAGQASDTNIDALTFTAFDGNKKIESKTIALGSHTIKSNLSEFDSTDPDDTFYRTIYGNDANAGEKEFFYTAQASDKAREYKDPVGRTIGTIGNISTEYYLFDETSTIVSADKLHTILTGEYYTDRATGTVTQSLKDASDEIRTKLRPVTISVPNDTSTFSTSASTGRDLARFTLDPKKNPTYALVGPTAVTAANFTDLSIENKMSTASPIVVELSPNKDGIPLDGLSITIRALRLKLDITGKVELSADGKTPIYGDDKGNANSSGTGSAYRLYPGQNVIPEPSGGKFTFHLNQMGIKGDVSPVPTSDKPQSGGSLVKLPAGSAYIIEVTGKDKEGNEYSIGDEYYGFFIEGSGQPPKLSITHVDNEPTTLTTVQVKGDKKVTFKGTVESLADSTDKKITLSYNLSTDTQENIHTALLSPLDTSVSPNWEFEIPKDTFDPAISKTYTLKITAEDADKKSTEQEFWIYYDVQKPAFAAEYLSYEVEDNAGIKKITVQGTSSDDDRIASYSYEVKVGDVVKIPRTEDIPTTGRFNFNFDTTGIADPTTGTISVDTKVWVTVKDRVGNETTASVTLDSTAPTIEPLNHSVAPALSGNSKIINVTGTASDDYIGIASYSYDVKVGTEVKKSGKGDITGKIDFTFDTVELGTPLVDDITVDVTVYDKLGNEASQSLTVDTHAPTLGDACVSDTSTLIGDVKWYNTAVLSASITAKDKVGDTEVHGSGVASVEWSTDKTKWNHLVRGAETSAGSGTYPWTGNIPVESGTHTITFRATDAAHNESEPNNLVVNVDLDGPIDLKLVSIDDNSSADVNQYSKGDADIKVIVNGIADNTGGSGIKDVRLYKIGSTTFADSSENPAPTVPQSTSAAVDAHGKATIIIAKNQLPDSVNGGVVFRVKDNVGNVTDFTPFTLAVDGIDPTLNLSHSVEKNPIVASDGVTSAPNNKTVTVTGNASDNTQLAAGGSYVVRLKPTTGDATIKKSGIVSDAGSFNFAFDTKDIANEDGSIDDGKTVEIEVIVKDRAGNETIETFTLDSIAPELTITKPTAAESANKTWYKDPILDLEVTATDNEGGRGVELVEWATTATDPAPIVPPSDATWTQMSGSGDTWTGRIPVTNGAYTIFVRATDKDQNVSGNEKITVNVDLDGPATLNLDTVVIAGTPQIFKETPPQLVAPALKDDENITVTVKDAADTGAGSGIKDVRLYKIGTTIFTDHEDHNEPTDVGYHEDSATSGDCSTAVAVTDDIVITKKQVDAAAKTSGGVVFRLTDNIGNHTDFNLFTLTIDANSPTLNSLNYDVTTTVGAKQVTVTGFAVDNIGLATYSFVVAGGSVSTGSGNTTGEIKFTFDSPAVPENENTIPSTTVTVKVKDKAGNETLGTTITLDSTAPTISGVGHTVSQNALPATDKRIRVTGTASDAGIGLATEGSYVVKVAGIGQIGVTEFTYPRNNNFDFYFDTDGFGAGDITVEVTVYDKLGNKSLVHTETVDTHAPTWVGDASVSGGISVDSETWYDSAVLSASITAKDKVGNTAVNGSGVASVEWSDATNAVNVVDGTPNRDPAVKWNHLVRGTETSAGSGTYTWTGNIPVVSGTHTIYFLATDGAFNVSAIKSHEVKVDLEAPITLNLEDVAIGSGTANADISQFSNKLNPIRVNVSGAADNLGGSGIKDVRLLRIGSTTFADSSENPAPTVPQSTSVELDDTVSIDISVKQLTAGETGGVVFRLTDKVGNFTDFTPFTLTMDGTDPTLNLSHSVVKNPISTPTGVVATLNNKTVIVRGNASDNTQLASGSYVVRVTTASGTTDKPAVDIADVGDFTFNLETKDIVTGDGSIPADTTVKVEVTVKDRAGNSTIKEFILDSLAPNLKDAKVSAPATPAWTNAGSSKDWYKSNVLTVEITAEEVAPTNATASGVTSVEWKNGTAGEWTQMLSGADNKWTGNVSFTTTGDYAIYFRATDAALNVYEEKTTPLNVSVDIGGPTALALDSVDGNDTESKVNKLTNAKRDITVLVKDAADNTEGSGIKDIRLVKIGSTDITDATVYSITSSTTSITITTAQVVAGTTGGVVFRLTDKVGNSTDFTLFSMTIDGTEPTAIITDPIDATEVNGTITIRGTADDNNTLAEVVLEYKDTFGNWMPIGGTDNGVTTGTYGWQVTLDTTLLTDKTDVSLHAKVTDTAGNEGYSLERTIKVNQDSDRPIIRLSNLNLAGMSIEKNVWLKNASTLYGTVTDDDGISKFEISTDGGSNYGAPTTFSSGSWSHTISTDGEVSIFFRVTDTANTTPFTSRALGSAETGLQTSPKLTDSETNPNQFGYTDSSDFGSSINLRIDTEAPVIHTAIHIDTTPDASGGLDKDWFDDADDTSADILALTQLATNMELGGTKGSFSLRIQVEDANAITSVQVLNGTMVLADAIKKSTDGNVSVFITPVIDTTALANSNTDSKYVVLTIKATDGAGVETSITRQIIVDNKAPTIKISTPANTDQVTGIVEIRGTADDGNPASGFKSIQYLIPKRNSTNTDWLVPTAASPEWQAVTASGLSWRLRFEEASAPGMLKNYANSTYSVETSSNSEIWEVPVLFRIEDNLGNVRITTTSDYMLWVDPEGDKPIATPIYPVAPASGNLILGGAIRISGTAVDNIAVKTVYMQIDTNSDGGFDDTDKNNLIAMIEPDTNDKIYTVTENIGTSEWGIAVDGTNYWSTTINASGEFNPTGNDVKIINYRVCAVDTNDLVGEWSDPIQIRVDKNAPKIGSAETLKLVQYADNTIGTGDEVAVQDYVADMWITGKWYLTGSIKDESGIESITVSGGLTGHKGTNGWFTTNDSYPSGDKGYDMKIPLDGGIDANLSFTIDVIDGAANNPGIAKQTISVNRDNTAPDVRANLTSRNLEINNTNTVQQSDTTFTFGSTAVETGSGFSHIAFWFERDVTGDANDRIYNVMESRTGDANRTYLNTLSTTDEIPRLSLTGVTRGAEDTLTHNTIVGKKNVRAGSLVKIGGVDRFITNVDYVSGTITFTPSVATTYITAEIAYVMVVNNQTIETQTVDASNNPIIANDDGDGMVESVERSGGNYVWTASIDSRNIPDGPINIKYVAYDKAGNASVVKTVASKVENNKPAIAKVWLGTDLDGDGSMDGEFGYSTLVNNEPTSDATVDALGATGSLKFTAKGKTFVTPEIVGGNGDLHYSLEVPDGSSANVSVDTSANASTRIRTGDYSGTKSDAVRTGAIVLGLSNGKLLGLEDTVGDAGREFVFTIWDSTEETTPGDPINGSQTAKLTVKMHVDAVDDVAPQSVISPFYWTSKTDNSLYEVTPDADNRDNGHIELEADLPVAFIANNAADTLLDRDAKVSGKISIRGTAYDDKILNEIWASIDGFTFVNALVNGSNPPSGMVKLATYNPNTTPIPWDVGTGTVNDNGWKFTVTENTLGQDGHSVEWQLDWDSQKLGTIVGLDKNVTIISRDKAGNDAVAAAYRMDIVPYIKTVTTKLSSIDGTNPTTNSRTALGRYPVYEGEVITLTGFNMGSDSNMPTVTLNLTDLAVSAVPPGIDPLPDSLTVEIGATAASGNVEITVGGVKSLNNLNNNGNSRDKKGEYNKTPNNANNNNLVDDVAFDVWGTTLTVPEENGKLFTPELRINPKTGAIGLAFVNGNFYFNMPGSSGISHQKTERGWGLYYESAMAFDPQGNIYALSTNQDVGVGYSASTTFYFDGIRNGNWNTSAATYLGGQYRRRIMATTTSGNDTTQNTSTTRVRSPAMAATLAKPGEDRSDSNRSNVYFAYYDDLTDQIRYQWGTIGSTLEKQIASRNNNTFTAAGHGFTMGQQVTFTKSNDSFNPGWNNAYVIESVSGDTFTIFDVAPTGIGKGSLVSAIGGQIMDIKGGWSDKDNAPPADMALKNYTLLAGASSVTGKTAGEQVSLDAIRLSSGTDLVVITWVDAAGTLWYTYNATDPQSDDSTNWSTTEIDASVEDNTVKIDSDGNIHIAYSSISGSDLKYVKFPYATATSATAVIVDSYQLTGTQMRLDIAKDASGKQVPYISYYAPATLTAKMAYQVNLAGNGNNAGANADKFTGNWEVSNIPTPNRPTEDTINIGVHKTAGVLTAIPTNPSGGGTGGNGTTNPVVAYVIRSGGLEVVQKK